MIKPMNLNWLALQLIAIFTLKAI